MLTGTENTLKALLDTEIRAAILAFTGSAVQTPNVIIALSEGIAEAVIPHFVSNTDVLPGTFNVATVPVVGIGTIL